MDQWERIRSTINATIIAGGSGRRMGGRAKGLIPLQGQSLIEHIIQRLNPQCHQVTINSNTPELYNHLGLECFPDKIPGAGGPLVGILTAMDHFPQQLLLTLPCDTPLIPADLVQQMYHRLQQQQAELCTIQTGSQLQSIFMLLAPTLVTSLRNYIQQGGNRVQEWVRQQHYCSVHYPSAAPEFININTPADLATLEQSLSHG